MGFSMRPVNEVWGTGTDQFMERDDLLDLLVEIGEKFGTVEQNEYSDLTVVWIENGAAFLDYIASDAFQPESEEQKYQVEAMRALANIWRTSLGSDKSLRFYLD